MKANYFFESILTLMLCAFFGSQLHAQYRIVEVDPATDTVTIKNVGSTTQDISSYRFCSLFDYTSLGSFTVQSGSLNLAPDQEVVLVATGNYLNDTAADLGLYLPTGSFGDEVNMVDFMQYGAGGLGREVVAVDKGIWTAGTFINVSPPYSFFGEDNEFGVNFWQTVLGINDLNPSSNFSIYPNPSNSIINIELNGIQTDVSYQVFNILGKQISAATIKANNISQIDVSSWNNGIYLIKISSEDMVETKRFIKQ